MRNRFILLLAAASLLAGVACESKGQAAGSPAPTPSVRSAVCDGRSIVSGLVGQIRTGRVRSKEDAANRLVELVDRLRREAERLDSQGFIAAARRARNLASAASEVAVAVEGTDASRVASASGKAATAIRSIRGCATAPSPSSSGSEGSGGG
jgi:hypothetical protein